MPAHSTTITCAILLLSIVTTALPVVAIVRSITNVHAPAMSPGPSVSGLKGALQWLSNNQSSDGSYGPYYEHWAAAAGFALWLNDTQSSKAALSYKWLSDQMNNQSSWFWGVYGEADVPGAILSSIAASDNLRLVHNSTVAPNLLQFQQTNGGFFGYYSMASQTSVTSSVDTSEALRGLISAREINASSERSAVNYLFSLQNPDGSFNLTSSMAYDPVYSQGPEPVSITALVLLALKDASFISADSRVSKALSFISSTPNYTLTNDTGAVYSASLSALALSTYGRTSGAASATSFIVSHQDPDGGFRDSIRRSAGSNAFDTAWAAIALEKVNSSVASSGFLPQVVFYGMVIGLVALAVGLLVVVYLVRRNRIVNQTKNG